MLCTVVIPTCNRAALVGRAIESVLASLPDAEVIVVDDGSTDHTPDVVSRFAPRVRYERQRNAGAAAARNTGIRCARGEFLAFLDDDDQFIPGAHKRMAAALEDAPDVGVVFGDVLVNDLQAEFLRGHRHAVYDDLRQAQRQSVATGVRALDRHAFLRFQLLSRNCVLVQAAVMRKRVVDLAGPFEESLGGYEEWEYFTRLAATTTFAYFDEACVRIEKHESNMSRAMEMMVGNAVRVRRLFAERDVYTVDPAVRTTLHRLWRDTWLDWSLYALGRNDLPEARRRLSAYAKQFGFRPRPAALFGLTFVPPGVLSVVRSIKKKVVVRSLGL